MGCRKNDPKLALAVNMWFMKAVPDTDVMLTYETNTRPMHLIAHAKIAATSGLCKDMAVNFLAFEKCCRHTLLKGEKIDSLYRPYGSPYSTLDILLSPLSTGYDPCSLSRRNY